MQTLTDITNKFGVPLVKAAVINGSTTGEVLNAIQQMNGIEGFVFRFDDGTMYKAKTSEYVDLHKAVSYLTSEKDILRLVLKNQVDDIKAALTEEKRVNLEKFENAVIKNIEKKAEEIWWKVAEWRDNKGPSQKKFAVECVNAPNSVFSKNEKSTAFAVFNHDLSIPQTVEFIVTFIINNCGTGPKVESVRDMFGGVRWRQINIDS